MLIMDTLAQIAHKYTVLLVDITGVLSDGKQYNQHAIQTLLKYKILGKKIVLFCNYPRDAKALVYETNLNEECYNYIWTSGEYMKHTLCRQSKPLKFFFINNHAHVWCDVSAQDSCMQVNTAEECDFIVIEDFPVSGMNTNHHLIEEYALSLKNYDKPIICLSREKQDVYGTHMVYQIGELGELCENMGMKVTYLGKGEKAFYKSCLSHCAIDIERDKILFIGDNLITDITATQEFVKKYEEINGVKLHLDTALMSGGLYNTVEKTLHEIELSGVKPTYVISSL